MLKNTIARTIVVLLAVSSSIKARDRASERALKGAIDALKVEQVKALLAKGKGLTKENGAELLKKAEEIATCYEENRSIFATKVDTASVAGGVALNVLGLLSLGSSIKDLGLFSDRYDSLVEFAQSRLGKEIMQLGVISLSSFSVGLYLLKRGLTGTARTAYLEKAETIVDLIEEGIKSSVK